MNRVLYNFEEEIIMFNGRKMVFIVNGKPRAGKDTFAQILNRYMKVYKYSAVTKVKEIATLCGWDGTKEERDRKFLHELKMLTTEYNDMSYLDILDKIEKFDNGEIDADVFVVDIREPEEIERVVNETQAFTVFIENENVPNITSNNADANVENYTYDFTITNNGTLEEFEDNVKIFIELLMVFTLMADDYEDYEE